MQISIDINYRATVVGKLKEGIIVGSSIFSPGGVELSEDLVEYLKENHRLLTSRLAADQIIRYVGAVLPVESLAHGKVTGISGRSLETGQPAQYLISTNEVCDAISNTFNRIVLSSSMYVESLVEYNTDVENEIIFTGDYAHLPGAATILENAIRVEAMPNARIVIR